MLAAVQVTLDVWYPSNLTLTAADATLNSVLPINAAPSNPSCSAFQSTELRLTASWTNGGTNPEDMLAATDVTGLAMFLSNDTNVAQVFGSMVKVGCTHSISLLSTRQAGSMPAGRPYKPDLIVSSCIRSMGLRCWLHCKQIPRVLQLLFEVQLPAAAKYAAHARAPLVLSVLSACPGYGTWRSHRHYHCQQLSAVAHHRQQ